jgi:hypothetical protein
VLNCLCAEELCPGVDKHKTLSCQVAEPREELTLDVEDGMFRSPIIIFISVLTAMHVYCDFGHCKLEL